MNNSTVDQIRAALTERTAEVVLRLFPEARRDGTCLRVGDLSGKAGSSLSIEVVRGDAKGAWQDFNSGEKGGILDLIMAREGCDFRAALDWGRDFLGWAVPDRSFPAPKTREGEPLQYANVRVLEANARQLQQRPEAMAYLMGERRGLTSETISHFHLGLTSYQEKQTGTTVFHHALTCPQLDSHGKPRARFLRFWIPDITSGAKQRNSWASGLPNTHWVTPAAGRRDLLVCEGPKDGWRLWQAIQGTPLADRLCIVTSTHGSVIPQEWKTPDFWESWDTVYAGQDVDEAGENMALQVRRHALRDVQRVRVPEGCGKDWTEYFNGGASVTEFLTLLQAAPVSTEQVTATPINALVAGGRGYFDAVPVDLSRSFVNGHLYYAFRALEIEDDDGRDAPRWRNLVLRSDGAICKAELRQPKGGTPNEDRVLALEDGTLLTKMPKANPHRTTFSTSAITRFSEARKQQRSALTLTAPEMLALIDRHLRSKVILPYEHDYAILVYVVVTSYVQSIFEAVPLVLVMGVAGSGKSELGMAIAQVSCNAVVLNGQTSAASVARTLDSVGGLAVLDDLEGIGSITKNKGDFGELIQQLKVSYKKSTAQKLWTNTQTMQVEELNFYGVKVINNTEGADAILSTRMLKIYTKKIPKDSLGDYTRPLVLSQDELKELRTNLHIFAMENAQDIARLYQERFSLHNERQEEITAPLRLLAEFMGDPASAERLAGALQAHEAAPVQVESGVDLLHAAVKELIRQGYRESIAMPQLEFEMRRLTGSNAWGMSSTTEIPEWLEPRWVGRQLRTSLIVDPLKREDRPRLWGQQIRLYPLDAGFVAETLNELNAEGIPTVVEEVRPLAYCVDVQCGSCPYATFCDFQEKKALQLKKRGSTPVTLH